MTATRERAINLRDWEVRANQDGRLKMLVRPVKPQPNNPEVFGVSPIWGSCVPTEYTPGVRSGSIPAKCVGRYTIHAATNENGQRVDRWIACPYGKPRVPQRTAAVLRMDLTRAGIPIESRGKILDFHAFRAAYITHIVQRGTNPATAQQLARHSDVRLTLQTYTDVDVRGKRRALGEDE